MSDSYRGPGLISSYLQKIKVATLFLNILQVHDSPFYQFMVQLKIKLWLNIVSSNSSCEVPNYDKCFPNLMIAASTAPNFYSTKPEFLTV